LIRDIDACDDADRRWIVLLHDFRGQGPLFCSQRSKELDIRQVNPDPGRIDAARAGPYMLEGEVLARIAEDRCPVRTDHAIPSRGVGMFQEPRRDSACGAAITESAGNRSAGRDPTSGNRSQAARDRGLEIRFHDPASSEARKTFLRIGPSAAHGDDSPSRWLHRHAGSATPDCSRRRPPRGGADRGDWFRRSVRGRGP